MEINELMTRQHLGIVISVVGALCLAFTTRVKRQYQGEMGRTADKLKKGANLIEPTETSTRKWLLIVGIILVVVGTLVAW
jgi:hypothetical protein